LPIDQGIAVTGSVNQNGEVQAIGGVNHKIEGFYRVCKAMGLTGKQGVIIPKSNVGDLALYSEVVDAVREGNFHIWQVEHVDQGIELLTGVPAGYKNEDGDYPEGTVNYTVNQKLEDLAIGIKEFEDRQEDESGEEEATAGQNASEDQPS
jgi:predicted ATP-dependent protease